MKDRLHRTEIKKTSRRFKFTSLFIGALSIVTTIVLMVCLINTNMSNNRLVNDIDEYGQNINNSADESLTRLQKNGK